MANQYLQYQSLLERFGCEVRADEPMKNHTEFTDLCAGPHLMSVAPVKAFKLTNCTGAYWRGDSKNKMLCRVYGVSFPKAAQLEEHLTMLEEAKKRDHRKLGKELEIFTLMEEGPGFPLPQHIKQEYRIFHGRRGKVQRQYVDRRIHGKNEGKHTRKCERRLTEYTVTRGRERSESPLQRHFGRKGHFFPKYRQLSKIPSIN